MTKMIIGGAQIGGIQKDETREEVVARMLALMDQAHAQGVEFLTYPEMTLGCVDKRDSQGPLIMIQAVICDGVQLGTRPDVGRGVGVL